MFTDFHGSQIRFQGSRFGRHGRTLLVLVVVEMTMSLVAAARLQRIGHPSVEDRVDENEDGHEQQSGEKGGTQNDGRKRPAGRQDVGEKGAHSRQDLSITQKNIIPFH